jgi:hypothetical protein
MISIIVTCAGGILFIIKNGTGGGLNMTISFALYGVILFLYAMIAWAYARQKNYIQHQYWAIRTFSVASVPGTIGCSI